MANRQQIRTAIKASIATVYTGTVVADRHVDGRQLNELVRVFLESGEVRNPDLSAPTVSALVVSIEIKNGSDLELDQIGDQIEAAIFSDPSLGGLVGGVEYTGYQYGDDANYHQLFIKFDIYH